MAPSPAIWRNPVAANATALNTATMDPPATGDPPINVDTMSPTSSAQSVAAVLSVGLGKVERKQEEKSLQVQAAADATTTPTTQSVLSFGPTTVKNVMLNHS